MVVAVLTNGCRRFDLCLVAVLTTIVAVLVVAGRVGLSPFWLSPFRLVAVLTCIRGSVGANVGGVCVRVSPVGIKRLPRH